MIKITRKIKPFFFLAAASAALTATAAQAGDWEMRLTVYAGSAYNKLSMGQKNGASDSVDPKYDVPALLGGGIKAYFLQSGAAYWRDVKSGDGNSKDWILRVEGAEDGTAVQVKWDPRRMPSGKTLILKDEKSGTAADLKTGASFTYISDGRKDLVIELRSE